MVGFDQAESSICCVLEDEKYGGGGHLGNTPCYGDGNNERSSSTTLNGDRPVSPGDRLVLLDAKREQGSSRRPEAMD